MRIFAWVSGSPSASTMNAHDREAYTEAKAEFVRRVLDQRS